MANTKKNILKGGLADNADLSHIDPKEIERGAKHEMEHTTNARVAQEIAEDHLAEDPKYYQKLKRMEKGFKKKASVCITNSMDIMPHIVRGNPKLRKVVDHILNKRRGTPQYKDAVDAIKHIMSTAKKSGKGEAQRVAGGYTSKTKIPFTTAKEKGLLN